MVDTLHLLPPSFGPKSDPLLFGVAEALEAMFPVAEPERDHAPTTADAARTDAVEDPDAA